MSRLEAVPAQSLEDRVGELERAIAVLLRTADDEPAANVLVVVSAEDLTLAIAFVLGLVTVALVVRLAGVA